MKKLSFTHKIHLLLGVHIILWLNAANYSYIGDIVPTVIKMGLVGLWFGIALLGNKKFLLRYFNVAFMLAFFTFLCAMSKVAGVEGYFDQYGMNLIYALILLGVFAYYYYAGSKEELRFLLIVYLLDVLVVSVNTYFSLLEHPELARLFSTSAKIKAEIWGSDIPKGVGGYGMCYILVLMQPILAYYLNKRNVNLMIRTLIHGFIILLLFRAQITIAFIAYPILLILSYTYGKKEIAKIVANVIFPVLFCIFLVSLPLILEKLIPMASHHLAVRLEELRSLLLTREITGDDLYARMVLYKKSGSAFLANPFWGAFGDTVYGSHSTFLDILAAFGLLGFVGYCGILKPLWTAKSFASTEKGLKKTYRLIFITIVFLSVINPIVGSELLLAIIVIIPLSFKYLTIEQVINHEIDPN